MLRCMFVVNLVTFTLRKDVLQPYIHVHLSRVLPCSEKMSNSTGTVCLQQCAC